MISYAVIIAQVRLEVRGAELMPLVAARAWMNGDSL
jgi:hypothetical protein